MGQEHKKSNKNQEVANEMTDEEIKKAKELGETATKESLDNDVDAILDEIDDVLETNAEEFVRSYIQKGGQ